jgi:hypothetical protein
MLNGERWAEMIYACGADGWLRLVILVLCVPDFWSYGDGGFRYQPGCLCVHLNGMKLAGKLWTEDGAGNGNSYLLVVF